MILKCKPTYNFQSVEFEYEIPEGEPFDETVKIMFESIYKPILEGLMSVAPEQPKGAPYVDYSYKSKVKTITEEDLPKKEPTEPATEGQINYLVRLGVPKKEAAKLSKQEAWKMIQEMK